MKLILTLLVLQLSTIVSAQWVQKGLDIDGEASGDGSGVRVSMANPHTMAVSAIYNRGNGLDAGHVRVYRWNGSQWQQKGLDIDGENSGDNSGWSVSMPDSNTVAIGSPFNIGNGIRSGHVRVFRWNGVAWIQKGLDIEGDVSYAFSGQAVSMPDSNTIAIGSPFFNTVLNDEGKVKVFHWNGVAWIQKGNDIIGESWNDNFGWSISMPDTNVLAIGGPSNDGGNRNNTGHVRVYQWSGTNWVQKGLDIDGESTEDASGISISMPNENTLLIGAANNDGNGLNSGHARVFDWVNSSWIQRGQDIDGEAAGDNFGISVSMTSNNYILVGANNNDGNGTNAGHTRVYKWNGLNWSQVGIDIDGEFSDDRFGGSVSMCDSNIFVSGGSRNDGNGTDAGHVRVYRYGSITTSLKENYFKSGISIFPNPSKGEFFIELEEFSTTPLQILDLSGKVIREFQLISSRTNLDLTGLAEGVYFVMYGEVTKKLVITR